MNRRDLLKSGLLAGGSIILLPTLSSFKESSIKDNDRNKNYLKLNIGTIETYILSDGLVSLDAVQPIFAPDINENLVSKTLNKLHLKTNKFEAGINVLLIKTENKLILLDTGSGHNFGPNAGFLTTALSALGYSPSSITDIIITHTHVDHIGGILDKNDEFIYPNAKYHIAEREFQFWMSNDPDFTNSKGKADSKPSILFAQKVLRKIESKIHFFNYGDILFSCLKSELAEGHTLGHTVFTIFNGLSSVKHIVDTFHTPLLVTKPAWGTQWDVDFEKAVQTRERIINEGIMNKTLFMSCHLPWPGLGFIDQNNDGYSWNIYPYFNADEISI